MNIEFKRKFQISRGENCELKRLHTTQIIQLPYSFIRGSCATFLTELGNDETEAIHLCFLDQQTPN